MKEIYQYCRKCHLLSPLPSYFYTKEELLPDWKSLCIWCVEKIIEKKQNEEIAQARLKNLPVKLF